MSNQEKGIMHWVGSLEYMHTHQAVIVSIFVRRIESYGRRVDREGYIIRDKRRREKHQERHRTRKQSKIEPGTKKTTVASAACNIDLTREAITLYPNRNGGDAETPRI
jgi:hypothetical protein